MKNKSIWLEGIKKGKSKKVTKNFSTDILIIGGGITGLSTAYHLRKSKLNICLVEKNLIGEGVSSRTTGKLTFLQENIYTKLKEKSKKYYESQKEAIKLVEKIIIENKIDCDYEKVESFLYTDQADEIAKIKKEKEMLEKLNIKYKEYVSLPFEARCKYAISVENTAVFHPLKYLNELKRIIQNSGIEVYENSGVTSIKKENGKFLCHINGKIIKSKKVIIASHYPYFIYPYFIPLKTYMEKSYIAASPIKKSYLFSAITVSKPVESIRYHSDKKKYLILLKGSHKICNKYNNKDNFHELIKYLSEKNIKTDYIWSNIDMMTEDSLPYIGFIDKNLLIGTGYNTWGMTNGSIAGKILSDLVLNKENKYQELFDPKRNKQFKNILKYPIFMSYSIKSFIENKIIKNKSWYKDKVKFYKKDGNNLATYIDENNKAHTIINICPHMKCSLIFNEVEKTWDCPCHGSRFDIDGKCIFGPSKEDIGYKK